MRIAFFPGSREGGQFDTACTKRRAKAWTKKKTWKRLLRSPWKNYTIEFVLKTVFDSLVYNFPSQCPPDEDLNDFLANHVVDFYTRAKLVSQWTKIFIHFYLSISFIQPMATPFLQLKIRLSIFFHVSSDTRKGIQIMYLQNHWQHIFWALNMAWRTCAKNLWKYKS